MTVAYTQMKNEELMKLIEKYELDKGDYVNDKGVVNRQKLSNILKLIDVQVGKTKEAVVVGLDGSVENVTPKTSFQKGLSGMMVEITFYNTDENDLPYCQLALNGIGLLIPREKKVWIPKEFIDGVLQNAITTKMKMEVDKFGKIRYIPKQIPRLQHTVHNIKHIDVLRKEYDEEQKEQNKK